MGKIVLTNSSEWFDLINRNFEDAGFIRNMTIEKDGINLAVFKKLRLNNVNFYGDNKTWIAVNGTLIYKTYDVKTSLPTMLEDLKKYLTSMTAEKAIKIIRRDCIGSFIVFLCANNKLVGFTDEAGTYAFYYYIDDNKYLLTNTYYHIGKIVKTEINKMALIDQVIRGTVSGNQTLFTDVLRLKGDEFIQINGVAPSSKAEILRCEINHSCYNFASREEAVKTLENNLVEIGKKRKNAIKGKSIIFTTGGLDSRLEVALHSYCNNDFQMAYWTGDDAITNGTEEDLCISKAISAKERCDFTNYDVSVPFSECIGSINSEECNRFGEYVSIYSHNKKWLDIPNKCDNEIKCAVFGYFGELIRPLSELDGLEQDYLTFDEVIEHLYCRNGADRFVFSEPDIYSFLQNELIQLYPLKDKNKINKEDAYNLFNRTRYHSDTICYNFMNAFIYGYSPFMEQKILDILEAIPYEWKIKEKITIELVKKWDKDLLEIPIYSHHHTVKFNSKKETIEETLKHRIKMKIKKIVISSETLSKFYHIRIAKYMKGGLLNQNTSILSECKKILDNTKVIAQLDLNIRETMYDNMVDIDSIGTLASIIKLLESVELSIE